MKKLKVSKRREDAYLQANVKDGKLVISVGIDILAMAFEFSEYNNPYDEDKDAFVQRFFVKDKLQFAKDISDALTVEEEDGSTMLTYLLDHAMEVAVNRGSTAVEECTDGLSAYARDHKEGTK
jgi:hypothetical protein